MSCAHSDGWFAVPSAWKSGEDGAEYADAPALVMELQGDVRIVGRCRIFAPHFESGTECAEGLLVETEAGMRYGLYWAKPSRTFRLVHVRERAP